MTLIKTVDQIEKIRIASKLAVKVLKMIQAYIKPGMTTDELNTLCHHYIVDTLNATPAPLNYHGFPKSICTSLNYVVCHGIPSDRKLKKGDILNIDITVIKDGYHGDTSMMFTVGEAPPYAKRLIRITQECLYLGTAQVKPGAQLGDIGHAIQQHAEKNHYSVVKEFCGHGIGKAFHEDPQVLHFGEPHTGLTLETGMVFTIEPMINAGKAAIKILKDGWTVITKDHKLSAQWEHTILVTPDGYEVLTLRDDETDPATYVQQLNN
jgi:methionyl aminopeptidase